MGVSQQHSICCELIFWQSGCHTLLKRTANDSALSLAQKEATIGFGGRAPKPYYPSLKIIFENNPVARLPRFEMRERCIRLTHREIFGDRLDIVARTKLDHLSHGGGTS